MAKKLFIVSSIVFMVLVLLTITNSLIRQGAYYSASRSYFLAFLFLASFVGLYLEIYHGSDPSIMISLGFLLYALIAFILFIEGTTIV